MPPRGRGPAARRCPGRVRQAVGASPSKGALEEALERALEESAHSAEGSQAAPSRQQKLTFGRDTDFQRNVSHQAWRLPQSPPSARWAPQRAIALRSATRA